MKLVENINKISQAVKNLSADSKAAASATAAINAKLKFDSSNVNLVVERFEALQKELDANNAKLQGLKKAQRDLQQEKAKITTTDEESVKKLREIEILTSQYTKDIQKAEANQLRLNDALSQGNKNTQLIRAATEQVTQKFAIAQQAAEKFAQAAKTIYSTLKQIVVQATETGVALSATAKKYNTNAEDIQTWNYALQLATGQSELFTNALSVMVKGMSQVASGRGVAFQTALREIGVSYKEIANLDAADQFEAIIEGLAGIENQSMRSSYAIQLLGDAGNYISSVLADGGAALDGYKEKASSFGIITNSDAEALAEMNIALQQAKSQFAEAKAELALALQPALEAVTTLIRDVLAPAVRTMGDAFKGLGKGGQTALLIIGSIIIIVPKVIKGLAAIKVSMLALSAGATTASVAMNLLKTSMIGVGVAGAIIGVIGLLGSAFSKSAEQTDEATEALKEYKETAEGLTIAGGSIAANTESTATSMTTKTVEIGVEISGKGDTEVSDDAAVTIAQLTADEVQRAWGDLTK